MDNQEIMISVLNKCFQCYRQGKDEDVNINIEIVSNIYERMMELSNNQYDIAKNRRFASFIYELNGTVVMGNKMADIHRVLISQEKFDKEDMSVIDTLIHETTHIYDYIKFWKRNSFQFIYEVEKHSEWCGFYFWTEFNARRNGYTFYINYCLKILEKDNQATDQAKNLKEIIFPSQLQRFKKDIASNKYDSTIYAYTIVQFLATCFAWNELVCEKPNVLPDYLFDIFGQKIGMVYEYLCNHKEFKDVQNDFINLGQHILDL